MINQSYAEKQSDILWQIHESVPIYERDNKHQGNVKCVEFPRELAEEKSPSGKYLLHISADFRLHLLCEKGFFR